MDVNINVPIEVFKVEDDSAHAIATTVNVSAGFKDELIFETGHYDAKIKFALKKSALKKLLQMFEE